MDSGAEEEHTVILEPELPWYCTGCGQRKAYRDSWCCIMHGVDNKTVYSVDYICILLTSAWMVRR